MYDIFEKLKSLNTAPTVTGTPEFLVVGLGNPEPKYDTTRHNAGFMAIDHIAQKTGCKVNQLKFKSLCGMCEIEGKKVMLHQADYLYEQLGGSGAGGSGIL